jgi:hypothetical protein
MSRRVAQTKRAVAAVAAVAEAPAEQSGMAAVTQRTDVVRVGFAPIVRVDAPQREIELCATSEAVDSFGTIFDYAASKDAFTRWLGNVREMHERRAVGRRVGVRCDDAERKIFVRVRVSRGAQDTWEKVLDGTLRGASIGASNVTWRHQVRSMAGQERPLNAATHYDLVELSLVDNPSNPDALGVTIVRDALPDARVLAALEGEAEGEAEIEAGAQASTETLMPADEADEEIVTAEVGERALPADLNVVLPESQPTGAVAGTLALDPLAEGGAGGARARGAFSSNAAGYPDTGVPEQAEERPTPAPGAGGTGNLRQRFHTAARSVLQGCGCAACQGAMAYLDAGTDLDETGRKDAARGAEGTGGLHEAALTRAVAAGLSASAARLERMDGSVDRLRAAVEAGVGQMARTMGDLRQRIEQLEAQPVPGGPAARAVDKALALGAGAHGASPIGTAEQLRTLESLAGRLSDPQAQIAVAAEMIRLQQERER